MSHLQYYNYPGAGQSNSDTLHYSQAVRFGNTIELSGQGGWNETSGELMPDVGAQIDQAFRNVELALKTAGGDGWDQVYRVRSYHVPLDQAAIDHMVRNFRQWMKHRVVWTCVQVEALADPAMKVEIEVMANAQ